MGVTNERLPARRPVQLEPRLAPAPAPEVIDVEFSDLRPRRLRDHLRVLVKYRWLMAICCTVCLVLTVLYLHLTPPVYVASTRLQVARESPIQLRLDENVLRVG